MASQETISLWTSRIFSVLLILFRFGSVFYRIYDPEGVLKQDFVSSFIKWKGGELQMATNSLTLLPSNGGIYAPCPLIWVGSGTDHQNIAEVMLCQFPCTGLKRLTASASFLRILLLREATCHAGRGPELTKVGGRQGEMLASPSCSSHSNWNADMSLKKASWTSKAATENCNRR